MARVFGCEAPNTIQEKKAFLLRNNVALWDVIASCEIVGSSDSSIKNAIANDLAPILAESQIERIYVNGATAKRLYDRYIFPKSKIPAELLPSTSPANAAWSLERLIERWKIIRND